MLFLAFGVELNEHFLWAEELYVWKHWYFDNFFFIFLYFFLHVIQESILEMQ